MRTCMNCKHWYGTNAIPMPSLSDAGMHSITQVGICAHPVHSKYLLTDIKMRASDTCADFTEQEKKAE